MALAAEQRLHIEMLAAKLARLVHVGADAGEALEIFLDVIAGLFGFDAELGAEAEGGNPVDDAEIDRLGAAAHFRRHLSSGTSNISDAVMA